MKLIKANLKSIIIVILIILGLIVSVYLVKNPQIFKSRADASRFEIVGKDGEVNFQGENFTTTSDHITVKIRPGAVESGLFNRPKTP